MTFSEKRQGIRAFRKALATMRALLRACRSLSDVSQVSLTLPRDEWQEAFWALGHIKQWIPPLDESPGHYARLNLRFVQTSEARNNFMLKGRPVYCEDICVS